MTRESPQRDDAIRYWVDRDDVVVRVVLRIGSWCKRVYTDAAWLEVEDAVERLGLFESEELPAISHGMCPSCETGLLKAV